ncbi:MAG: hypothetical protein V7631_1552, partial [Massilia sp.]
IAAKDLVTLIHSFTERLGSIQGVQNPAAQ